MWVCPVMSDSETPWTVALQAASVHGISQARIPEWAAKTSDATYCSAVNTLNRDNTVTLTEKIRSRNDIK